MPASDPRSAALLRASTPIPPSTFADLITANHILHAQNVVDAYGHVSVRNPQDPSKFFLAKRLAPALIASRSDIEEYHVEDASPVHKTPSSSDEGVGYVERYIHSELYKKFSDVHAVVHAHSEPVIPFSITSVPFRPVFHLGGTVGAHPPIYDISLHAKSSDSHDLLISSAPLGASLANAFNPSTTVGKASNLIRNYITSSSLSTSQAPVAFPPNPIVLMRGHGFTAVGTTLQEAVSRAVYTVTNARIQTTALLMQGSFNVGLVAEHFGNWDGVREGTGGGPKGQAKQEGLRYLSEKEVKDSAGAGQAGLARCWALWCAEVREKGLYRNEMEEEAEEEDEEGGEE